MWDWIWVYDSGSRWRQPSHAKRLVVETHHELIRSRSIPLRDLWTIPLGLSRNSRDQRHKQQGDVVEPGDHQRRLTVQTNSRRSLTRPSLF